MLPKFCGTAPGVSCSRSKKLPRPRGIFSTSSGVTLPVTSAEAVLTSSAPARGNGDLFAGGADFEFEIDVRRLGGLHGAVGNGGRFKAFGGDGDVYVPAGSDGKEYTPSLFVAVSRKAPVF